MCNELRICTPAQIRKPKLKQRVKMVSYAVFSFGKMWKKKKLYVHFLDGDQSQQEMVMAGAYKWSSVCGLDFGFVNDPDVADIRVSFKYTGAWSAVGTDAKFFSDKTEPTMNFGFIDLPTVLHEFGHAIGFNHEHQNPLGGIKWNAQKVIKALSGPPNNWNLEQIKHNVLNKPDSSKVKSSFFDRDSIMLYSFPDEWTTDGKGTKQNETLSKTDIAWARRYYPRDNETDPQTQPEKRKSGNGVLIGLAIAVALIAWFVYGLQAAS